MAKNYHIVEREAKDWPWLSLSPSTLQLLDAAHAQPTPFSRMLELLLMLITIINVI